MPEPSHGMGIASGGRPYLNTRQSAHFLGLSVRTLEQMRSGGTGPRFRRHGRLVFYHVDDLESWSRATTLGELDDG
ncbi:MAG: helix-turn-helix domain-containing protein [Sphingomonas sp.]|uniref:helix-turn-helix domain-containing protein n=1 Tax=Sphingomonas sp. TaxID=28214 RepID=UPI002275A588|nr:helix-turn-helix domain-containing protein [Sphingomonas sp.]MCX8477995.1 helix-turn-helix domain-containing protein [Sphingomonas sp.]